MQISNLIDWVPICRVLDEMYDNSVDCIVWIDDNNFNYWINQAYIMKLARGTRIRNPIASTAATHGSAQEIVPGTDISIYEMTINRAGEMSYTYYMASQSGLSRDAYIGSTRRINRDEAMERSTIMRSNLDSIKRANYAVTGELSVNLQ